MLLLRLLRIPKESVSLIYCKEQDVPPEMIEMISPGLFTWFAKAHRGLTLPSRLFYFFFPFSFPHIKQTALLKDSCVWTLGSLKNDPLQSSFFTLTMKFNIHEMDFPPFSPTHSNLKSVFAGIFGLFAQPC